MSQREEAGCKGYLYEDYLRISHLSLSIEDHGCQCKEVCALRWQENSKDKTRMKNYPTRHIKKNHLCGRLKREG